MIPGDGDVIEGIASVDESAITGESAPVIRESGGDRSAVTGGTRVLSDQIVVRITVEAGRDVPRPDDRARRGRRRGRRPRTRSRSTSCWPASRSSSCSRSSRCSRSPSTRGAEQSIIVLVALLVCLIPTTIGALLSAIGIAGMDRLVQRNVLAMSGRAVEAAGDVLDAAARQDRHDHLGNRQAAEFIPVPGRRPSTSSPTPRCSRAWPTRRPRAARSSRSPRAQYGLARRASCPDAELVPFTAQTRMSGVDLDGRMRSARARPTPCGAGSRSRAARCPRRARRRSSTASRPAAARRSPSPSGDGAPGARRDPPQGHREAGHARALRRAARAWASAP